MIHKSNLSLKVTYIYSSDLTHWARQSEAVRIRADEQNYSLLYLYPVSELIPVKAQTGYVSQVVTWNAVSSYKF